MRTAVVPKVAYYVLPGRRRGTATSLTVRFNAGQSEAVLEISGHLGVIAELDGKKAGAGAHHITMVGDVGARV